MTGFDRVGQARPLATAAEIAATEDAIGRPLPAPLRQMLRSVRNGGSVRANQMASHPDVGVDHFLRAGTEGPMTIAKRYEELGDELPAWFVPFADCSCGNLLGMDDQGRIHFWDHEEPDASRAVTLVARSLASLEDDLRDIVVEPEEPLSGWVHPDFVETLRRLRAES